MHCSGGTLKEIVDRRSACLGHSYYKDGFGERQCLVQLFCCFESLGTAIKCSGFVVLIQKVQGKRLAPLMAMLVSTTSAGRIVYLDGSSEL
mmetsp:Transcript_4391/g.6645  ORF Transcript_4391/g.6645 Transcript_4391/m.6645 type:complete len:91 (-) Transcript_4391:898-1170(-)